jgi:hypothetical protein
VPAALAVLETVDMQKTVEQRTCDNCGHMQSQNTETSFGGCAFKKWITMRMRAPSNVSIYTNGIETYDFCSVQCALTYLLGYDK